MSRRIAMMLFVISLLPTVVSAQTFSATLLGANEAPAAGDPDGAGSAVITISGTTIQWSISTQNVTGPTLAHIHAGPAGVAGSVVVDFNPVFSNGAATGSVANVSASTINAIKASPAAFYVNVHSSQFAGGAIRGQLDGPTLTTYIPVVGKVQGANNTNFVSALQLVNEGVTTANITVDFFESSASARTLPTATRNYVVNQQHQLVIEDIVGEMGLTGRLGALRVFSTSADVSVQSRIFNDQRSVGLGTTGFLVPGRELQDAPLHGVLPFCSEASPADRAAKLGFRTNVGFFNPNDRDLTLTLTILSPSGAFLGSNDLTIPALSHQQQSVFVFANDVPVGDRVLPNFYVSFNTTLPIFIYAGVNDNNTGDGVYVEP